VRKKQFDDPSCFVLRGSHCFLLLQFLFQSVWKVWKGFGSFSTVLQIISYSLGMYVCCLMITHTVATQTELKQQCDMRHACVRWWEKEGWGQGWGVLVVLGDFWLLVIMSKSLIRCSWHISEIKTNLCAWICPCVYVNTIIWRPTCSSYWDETLCEDSLENEGYWRLLKQMNKLVCASLCVK